MKLSYHFRMQESVIIQEGNKLQVEFQIKHSPTTNLLELTSSKHLCGAIYFQLESISSRTANGDYYCDYTAIVNMRFLKLFQYDNLTYTCTVSSEELKQTFRMTEDNTWYKTFEIKKKSVSRSIEIDFTLELEIISDVTSVVGPFATIYDDTERTDFKLCGEGGSVEVHKLVLSMCSPVLHNMLKGEWAETTEGKIQLSDTTTKKTLEHFKNYIYLNKLPSNGVEDLLLIGSYFMMPVLVQKCIVKLLNNLNEDNILDMVKFAATFNVTNLLVILLRIIKNGNVNIDCLSEENLNALCEQTNSILNFKNIYAVAHPKANFKSGSNSCDVENPFKCIWSNLHSI